MVMQGATTMKTTTPTKKTAQDAAKNARLEQIAKTILDMETLETRHSDRLDFTEQAVWTLKAALEAAYEAGRAARS